MGLIQRTLATMCEDGERENGDQRFHEEPHHTRLGISLSGGGIRSTTFSLGVCQRLIEAEILERARYLSGVSGGSYLAAGLAISHALCPTHLQRRTPLPWARGSPEEAHLRQNLSYLAPGSSGRLWLFANLLYGLILNLTPLVLGAFLCGRIVGLGLRWLYPGIGPSGSVQLSRLPWILGLAAVLVLGSTAVVGRRRFLDKDRSRPQLRTEHSERTVVMLLGSAAMVLVVGVVLPGLVDLLAWVTSSRVTANFGLSSVPFAPRRLTFGLAAVIVAVCLGGMSLWLLRRRQMPILRGILAYAAGGGILFAPFVLAAETAAVRGWSLHTEAATYLLAGGVLLLFAIFVHNRRYSMHLFYRERLQGAFASRRTERDGEIIAEPIPYTTRILLSEIAAENARRSRATDFSFPELIMCAAVAARGAEVPSKSWAASFTFEGRRSGNERLGLQATTTEIEVGDWIGGGNLTLPAMMAISGAAVSPLMGRFTLPAYRFLMAMLNIRLGVWIRNPSQRSVTVMRPDEREKAQLESNGHAEQPEPKVGSSRLTRLRRYVMRGWREPGAWYVLKEGIGLVDTQGRYIYVSDGGHWENLGLTELLRQRCTHVVVVDASGDPHLGDIASAIAVARAELGVEFIEFDPRVTLPSESGLAQGPVAVGSFRYTDGTEGYIFYARSVLWDLAPSDLHLFAGHDHRFPNHSTSNQFLSGELFDAYRALGWSVGGQLVEVLNLPPKMFDEPPAQGATGHTCAKPSPAR